MTTQSELQEELSAISPKNLILTLFGDYVYPRSGEIWTGSLIRLLHLLGDTSEPAVRAALSRMARKGWLQSRRIGRRSFYSLTGQGEDLLEAGTHRIFDQGQPEWDGQWWVLCYHIPEAQRRLRTRLRRQLIWLGFGRLRDAVYIAPYDRRRELDQLLHRLDVHENVHLFAGPYHGHADDKTLVEEAWDLEALNRRYAEFLAKYRPLYEEDCVALAGDGNGKLSSADCFVRRFMLIHEYRAFPFMDPGLPRDLLPEGWLGHRARQLFHQYYELLAEPALAFFEEILVTPPDRFEN